MKNKKTKLLTLSLASLLGAATLVGGVFSAGFITSADDPETTVKCSDVFATSSSASLDDTKEYLSVSFPETDSSVELKKADLALKWFEANADKTGGEAKYFNFTFKFENTNFKTMEVVVETASAWATKDEKTTNKVVFTNTSGKITAKVNDGAESAEIDATKAHTLALGAHTDGDYGAFDVKLDGTVIGAFTNVGANFAENTSEITPFTIKTTRDEEAEGETPAAAVLQIHNLNGQSFALTESKLKDTAVPAIIVNDEINGFMIGTQYTVSAVAVDVLDTDVSITTNYYQFNPKTYTKEDRYKKMSSKPYLPTISYTKDATNNFLYKENGAQTSVYSEYKMEYLSVKYTAKDDAHDSVPEVELVWYAESKAVVSPKDKEASLTDTTKYIKIDRNTASPAYSCVVNDGMESKFQENTYYNDFVTELKEVTKELQIGSNTYVYLPTMKGLVDDDNGYKNLKFTVSYKTEGATSPTTVSISSASDLKFSISKTGLYEFKIIASDQADNAMQAYLDGKLVDVTTSNVWDIDAIPSFSFEVQKSDKISVEDETASNRKTSKVLNSTYSLSGIEILGVASGEYNKDYALFKINTGNYQGLDVSDLSAIGYAEMQDLAKEKLSASEKPTAWVNGEYIEFYKAVYAELLAKKIDSTASGEKLAQMVSDLTNKETGVFRQIEEFDSRIDEKEHASEWKKNNKFNWNATDASFKTAEEGTYLILGVYSDQKISANKTAAYKVITSAEKQDVVEGETEWLKNNLVSVILFGIAGVMLILIIILLFVKPSDETLEDVDVKALQKQTKKKKSDE